jgi:hypothetical protein
MDIDIPKIIWSQMEICDKLRIIVFTSLYLNLSFHPFQVMLIHLLPQ